MNKEFSKRHKINRPSKPGVLRNLPAWQPLVSVCGAVSRNCNTVEGLVGNVVEVMCDGWQQ